ncbi:MAG TPA: hypothetical protein VFC00_00605 [Micromonosporaceae bacterium]|nr:hypothetical protein [Micromonosporaceae bacterium]
MNWLPVIHKWGRRIGLIVAGVLAGLAVPAQLTGDAAALFIMLAIACAVAVWMTSPNSNAPEALISTTTYKRIRVAVTETDVILQRAQQVADEITAGARERAAEIRESAEVEAQNIIDRARTVAAALDPASEHEPRVRRPES